MVRNFETIEEFAICENEYFRQIAGYGTFSANEELILISAAAQGDFESRKKLILSNLKIVVSIAKRHIHKCNIPFADLVQEGTMGLIYAISKFNKNYGCRFATYASWWIKQAMFKAISEQSFCVKIPVYVQETLSKYNKIKQKLENASGKNVSVARVAKEMNISEKKIDDYLNVYTQSLSLDAQIELANGCNIQIGETLADDKNDISSELETDELKRLLSEMLSKLKSKEQNVIAWRFGLNNEPQKTLEEIGKFYGVTKECIRQTELRAIKKLQLEAQKRKIVSLN